MGKINQKHSTRAVQTFWGQCGCLAPLDMQDTQGEQGGSGTVRVGSRTRGERDFLILP